MLNISMDLRAHMNLVESAQGNMTPDEQKFYNQALKDAWLQDTRPEKQREIAQAALADYRSKKVTEGRFSRFRDLETPTTPAEPQGSPKSQGWEAARQGAEVSANPFPKGTVDAREWDVGYQDYFFNESVNEDIRAVPEAAQAALRTICNDHGVSQTLEALAAIVKERSQRASSLVMQAANVIIDQG
jgi:hypothetical protein